MTIFLKESGVFERGTTVTSRVKLFNQDGEVIRADVQSGEHQIQSKVIHSNTGEVVREKEKMAVFEQDGITFYQAKWDSDNDAEEGDYYFEHVAKVGGDTVKKTKIFALSDITEC